MLLIILFFSFARAARYAVLLAGSNTFWNYRHQADIFTLYAKLINRGFTVDEITVMAFDDIANDPSNPFAGAVYHSLDHKTNIYPGSEKINVKGTKVSAQKFYQVLSSIPTTSEDYVFIYYDNHGGPGVLGVPDGCGDFITSNGLAKAMNDMQKAGKYKQCFFAIEACYAGSVAENIKAANLAIITAANNAESSYAAIYDSTVGTYLTNEFSFHFIDNIDKHPNFNIGQLFDIVKTETKESHVMYYGDANIKSVLLENFIAKPKSQPQNHLKTITNINENTNFNSNNDNKPVSQREATDITLENLATNDRRPISIRSRAKLELLRRREQTRKLNAALEMLVRYVDPNNFDKIMNEIDIKSEYTEEYFEILKVFVRRVGEVNPDDYGRFFVLKALAKNNTKAKIIAGIFAVL